MTTVDQSSIGFHGLYRGIVVNNVDPEGLARITATCPQVFGDSTVATDWAWPVFPSGWDILNNLPQCGVGVYLSFLGGDVNNPIWHGVWQAGS
jgi:hypothetical protein